MNTQPPHLQNSQSTAIAERAKPLYAVDTETKLRLAKRGVDEHMFNTLSTSLYPGAKIESILLVLDYCKSRGLDPMKKPAHIVPMWDKSSKGMRDVIMPGISEIRMTAMRTGEYAGTDGEEFGPTINLDLQGGAYSVPEWCRYIVYRRVGGQVCKFVGPKVYYREAYATAGKDTEAPNTMWKKRPAGQLSKCAEAAALRMAFPEEVGSDYAAEEMEGKTLNDSHAAAKNVSPSAPVQSIDAMLDVNDSAAAVVDATEYDAPAPREGYPQPIAENKSGLVAGEDGVIIDLEADRP